MWGGDAMDSGMDQLVDLARVILAQEAVDVRLAAIRVDDGWLVNHGKLVIGSPSPLPETTWLYQRDAFIARRVPGATAAALIAEQPVDFGGLKVIAASSFPSAHWRRMASRVDWNGEVLPWPRKDWEVGHTETPGRRDNGVLL